jgi:hypothetical protein
MVDEVSRNPLQKVVFDNENNSGGIYIYIYIYTYLYMCI